MSIAEDNEGPADKTFKKPAVRIDTFRNQLAGCRALLENVEKEAEDLQWLGYERQAAKEGERVKGGGRDFALDTHGDKRARDAYRELADVVLESVESIAESAHDALRFLRVSGVGTRRTPRQVSALELAEQIGNQARRIGRGEYTPVRRHPQPDTNAALVGLRGEAQRLSSERDVAREAVRLLEAAWPDGERKARGIPHEVQALVDRVLGREDGA